MADKYEEGLGAVQSVDVLQCVVVTPEKTALKTSAEFVAVPLYDGELGIAPRRAPMIGRLGYGQLRLVEGGKTRSFYVDGGFVQVAHNEVTILTGRAVPADQLDAQVAAEQLRLERGALTGGERVEGVVDAVDQLARAELVGDVAGGVDRLAADGGGQVEREEVALLGGALHRDEGAEAAAQHYFGRPAKSLTRRQAALLAVTLPNPGARNPAKPSGGLSNLAAIVEKRAQQAGDYVSCLR